MNVEIGTEASNSLSWNICFKFWVMCLCSETTNFLTKKKIPQLINTDGGIQAVKLRMKKAVYGTTYNIFGPFPKIYFLNYAAVVSASWQHWPETGGTQPAARGPSHSPPAGDS